MPDTLIRWVACTHVEFLCQFLLKDPLWLEHQKTSLWHVDVRNDTRAIGPNCPRWRGEGKESIATRWRTGRYTRPLVECLLRCSLRYRFRWRPLSHIPGMLTVHRHWTEMWCSCCSLDITLFTRSYTSIVGKVSNFESDRSQTKWCSSFAYRVHLTSWKNEMRTEHM